MRRIKQVTLQNLFWVFNHTVPFNLEEHITVIHGLNGYGKTTLLEMINGLFNGGSHIFWSTPFEKFIVTFDDNKLLEVERLGDVRQPEAAGIRIEYADEELKDRGENSFILKRNPNILQYARQQIELEIPELAPAGTDRWQDVHTDEVLYLEEVFHRYPDVLSPKLRGQLEDGENDKGERIDIPDWFRDIRNSVSIHPIKTNRLVRTDVRLEDLKDFDSLAQTGRKTGIQSMIGLHAHRLVQRIKDEVARYTARAQESDSSFALRSLRHIESGLHVEDQPTSEEAATDTLGKDQIKMKLDGLREKQRRLFEVGLLDRSEALAPIEVDPKLLENPIVQGFLSEYVRDMEYKFDVFDQLNAKIDLFKELVNKQLLFKRLKVDRERGFVFESDYGDEIPLSRLSSGEQHRVVLYYHLLFETKDNTLLLVDEPELSLHVIWQEEFLNDLERIIGLANVDILIATHSPQIVRDRWDLTIRLRGPQRPTP